MGAGLRQACKGGRNILRRQNESRMCRRLTKVEMERREQSDYDKKGLVVGDTRYEPVWLPFLPSLFANNSRQVSIFRRSCAHCWGSLETGGLGERRKLLGKSPMCESLLAVKS